MDANFEEIFQGWLEKEEYNKNKGFLKKSRYWKKYFCVLRRYDGDDNVYIQWFDKEEEWRKEFPKGSFGLFPKYSVFKRKTEKGKNYFEVSNDEEAHYFMAANEKTMDLWVIQLMMQTRLNSSMIETSYRVKGGDGKCLQRIGAKNLNCLLHVSEWGLTLALERTHAVLSQWPLTTIRNYECSDNNEFVFEAGRKSPMGEGKYEFITTNSEDNMIFDHLDRFTSLRAKRSRSTGGRSRLNSTDDQEIAHAYGKLRWSVMLNSSTINLGVIPAMSSQPQAIVPNEKQIYNHLDHKNGQAIGDSYDRLDRTGSFNSSQMDTSYSRLNCSDISPDRKNSRSVWQSQHMHNSYDHLERGSSFHGSPSSGDGRSMSFGSIEGRSRSQFNSLSSPPLEDGYNHLASYRHGSWSGSPRSVGHTISPDFYDRLDRSRMSIQQPGPVGMNSYDRLDSMQDVFVGQAGHMMSPPRPPVNHDPPPPYDMFGNNLKPHVPKTYQFTNVPITEKADAPLTVELPPPLPQKPSFMMQANKPKGDSVQLVEKNPNEKPLEQPNGAPEIPGETSLNGVVENNENRDPHYQDVDEANTTAAYETPGPRSRLNTHSSDPDLRKSSLKADGKLDPSKSVTLHRSAPSLALYAAVNKKKTGKGSPKVLSKTGSTFKLDSFLKRISRGSKKGDEDSEQSYEKIPRKSKKSQRKSEKDGRLDNESTSSLRRLVDDSGEAAYAEISENTGASTASGRSKMERTESKRPLPEIPQDNEVNA